MIGTNLLSGDENQVDAPVSAPPSDLAGFSAPAPAVPVAPPVVAPSVLSGMPTAVPTSAKPSFSEQLARAANHLGIPPGPGGWAKSLVGAAQSALSGLQDASTTPGGGVIAGVTQTLANRNARLQEEAQIKQKMMLQNAQNTRENQKAQDEHQAALGLDPKSKAMLAGQKIAQVHEQALIHQLGSKQIEDSVKQGKETFDNLTTGENPAPIIAKDKTWDELQREVDAHTKDPNTGIDPAAVISKPTGQKVVGQDEDGKPILVTTYSVAGVVPSKKVDQKTADFINRNMPDLKIMDGQVLTGTLYGSLTQQASSIAAATAARDKTLLDAGVNSQKLEAVNIGPEWNNALANAKGDPFRALSVMQSNPALRQKYPNLSQDVMQAYGGPKEWETMRDNRVKNALKQQELDANKIHEAGSTITDDVKAQLLALPPDRRAVLEKYPNEAGSLMAVAFGPGDLDFRKIFPERLTKGAPGINAQQAVQAIRAVNPNWSMQQYDAMHNAYKDITQGKSGIQIAQYNNVLQHAAGLQDVMADSARDKNPAFLNTAINLLQSKGWGAEAAKISTEVEAVKGEYELLMNAGYKPSDTEQKIYNKIASGDATPAQVGAFSKAVGSVGAVRLSQINQQYARIAGQNLPGILTKDTIDAARHLNLDDAAMKRLNALNVGDTIFHNPNWKQPTEVQAQETQNKQIGQDAAKEAAAVAALPPAAVSKLVEGYPTHFLGGQIWVLKNGKPVQVQGQK